MIQICNIRMILQFFRCKLMFFNQTLNGRIELGSYSVGKIRFFGVALDFAIEPVLFSPSPGNLFESMRGHPPVPGYQGEFLRLSTYQFGHVLLSQPFQDHKVGFLISRQPHPP